MGRVLADLRTKPRRLSEGVAVALARRKEKQPAELHSKGLRGQESGRIQKHQAGDEMGDLRPGGGGSECGKESKVNPSMRSKAPGPFVWARQLQNDLGDAQLQIISAAVRWQKIGHCRKLI
jgi:hypothetical protein